MSCWKKTVHGPRCFGAECTIVPATGEELKELMARVCGLCDDFFHPLFDSGQSKLLQLFPDSSHQSIKSLQIYSPLLYNCLV